jgi:hypothetical protein
MLEYVPSGQAEHAVAPVELAVLLLVQHDEPEHGTARNSPMKPDSCSDESEVNVTIINGVVPDTCVLPSLPARLLINVLDEQSSVVQLYTFTLSQQLSVSILEKEISAVADE